MQSSNLENEISVKPLPLDMLQWQRIINDWESSNQSQKRFCSRLGISFNTFSYARSKLARAQNIKPAFIPVNVNLSDHQPFKSENVVIENPRGFKLHISPGCSSEHMLNILKLSGWFCAKI